MLHLRRIADGQKNNSKLNDNDNVKSYKSKLASANINNCNSRKHCNLYVGKYHRIT